MKTYVIPKEASFNQIARCRRDNASAGEWNLSTDGHSVCLTGGEEHGSVELPRKTFNRLLRWYLNPTKFVRP